MATNLGPDEITHYVAGRFEHPELQLTFGDTIKSLQFVAGYGPVLGTYGGQLIRFDGQTWVPLPRGPVALRVFGVLPREQGLIYGGEEGLLLQYIEEQGFCEGVRATRFDLNSMTWLGDHIVGCGGSGEGTNTSCGIFSVH